MSLGASGQLLQQTRNLFIDSSCAHGQPAILEESETGPSRQSLLKDETHLDNGFAVASILEEKHEGTERCKSAKLKCSTLFARDCRTRRWQAQLQEKGFVGSIMKPPWKQKTKLDSLINSCVAGTGNWPTFPSHSYPQLRCV